MFLGCEVKPPENGDTLAQKAVVTGTSSNGKKFVVSGWHSCRLSNERNEITEGTFTNVAVRTGDRIFTPPVSAGLLNGIMRQKLIEEGVLQERTLYPRDLKNADAVYCLNSVRGMFEVELCF